MQDGRAALNGLDDLPPPLPPRPIQELSPSPYMYGASAGSYSPYFGGNPWSSYGMNSYGGLPYNNTGYPVVGEDRVVRAAEERSRSALQSVESLVRAFSSVTFMLESSLNAVYSSLRAILGVAQQFARLRTQLGQILSSLAILRLLRWVWRKLLVVLRIKPANYLTNVESAWSAALTPSADDVLGGKRPLFHWHSLLVYLFAVGGPWLIYKLASKAVQTADAEAQLWTKGEAEHFEARALYNFSGDSASELPLQRGQLIRVAPKELQPALRGWLLAGSTDDLRTGLVPINYIQILGKKSSNKEN